MGRGWQERARYTLLGEGERGVRAKVQRPLEFEKTNTSLFNFSNFIPFSKHLISFFESTWIAI